MKKILHVLPISLVFFLNILYVSGGSGVCSVHAFMSTFLCLPVRRPKKEPYSVLSPLVQGLL